MYFFFQSGVFINLDFFVSSKRHLFLFCHAYISCQFTKEAKHKKHNNLVKLFVYFYKRGMVQYRRVVQVLQGFLLSMWQTVLCCSLFKLIHRLIFYKNCTDFNLMFDVKIGLIFAWENKLIFITHCWTGLKVKVWPVHTVIYSCACPKVLWQQFNRHFRYISVQVKHV